MISAVPSVSSVHVELDGRLSSTVGRTDVTTKYSYSRNNIHYLEQGVSDNDPANANLTEVDIDSVIGENYKAVCTRMSEVL
jgi:hypothetical protein